MDNKEIIQVLKESLQLGDKEEIFSDDLLEKLSVIFEGKIKEGQALAEEQIKEELEEANRQEIGEFKSGLVDQLDEYLNYFVEKFLSENQEQIHEDVRVKTADKVLEKFNGIVNQFNMELDEETISQDEEIDELKAELNESINTKIELESDIAELMKEKAIAEKSQAIAIDSQKATFIKLAESFDYTDSDVFAGKLSTLSESLGHSEEKAEETLEEQEVHENQKELKESTNTKKIKPATERYVKYLRA